MSTTNFKDMFETLQFDIEEPNSGHEERFFEKLKEQQNAPQKKMAWNWKPFLGIAASIALILTVTFGINSNQEDYDLASVSPELAETQSFFSITIAEELEKLEQEKSPEVQVIIQDALKRLTVLENSYKTLKTDLTTSGDDNRVIHAMINNFQNRINLLQNTLEQIELVKQFKNNNYEIKNTI